jgi:hypothetical protein
MHCVDTSRTPAIDQDCWVVSISTNGMSFSGLGFGPSENWAGQTNPPSSAQTAPRLKPAWDIVFVDPSSGQIIEATIGN